MFSDKVIVDGAPAFEKILSTLHRIPTGNGAFRLDASFVSKLVNMHLESSPIYDEFVLTFFDETEEDPRKLSDVRIRWFIRLVNHIKMHYDRWAKIAEVATILDEFRNKDLRLSQCHHVRLIDFLVWKVGKEHIRYY